MLKFLFACLCVALGAGAAYAAPALTFEGACALLRERSDVLEAAGANTQASRDASEALTTLWGPTIGVQAADYGADVHIDLDRKVKTPLGNMPVRIDERKHIHGYGAAVSGTWPIFTGGKILAEQKMGEAAVAEAESRQQATLVDEEIKLIGHYFGLKLAEAIERVRREMLDEQTRELARAVAFEKHGVISKQARLGVQVAKDRSEREWLKARDTCRVARIQLAWLLRTEHFGALTTPLFVLKNGFGSMHDWVEASVAANPQIAIMDAQVKKADQGVAAAAGSFSPDIFAFGSYSFLRHYTRLIEPEWVAGIGMNFTIWDARGRIGRYRSAGNALREAKAMRAQAENQARSDAETAWQNTQNAIERYALTSGNVAYAKENLKLKTDGFEEGLNTALDMTEARTQLAEARVARKVAAYEFVVNFAILHAVANKMDEFLKAAARPDARVEN